MPHNLSPLCHNRRPGSTPATAYTHPCLASSLCSSNSCRRRARCQDRKHCNCAADIYCNNRQFHIETIPSSCGVVGYHVCFTSPCGIAQGPRFDSVREQPFSSPLFVHVQNALLFTLLLAHFAAWPATKRPRHIDRLRQNLLPVHPLDRVLRLSLARKLHQRIALLGEIL